MDTVSMLQRALQLHQAGALAQARGVYTSILRIQPGFADALHLLGVLCGQSGELSEAERLISLAISRDPHRAAYHANLGMVFLRQGKHYDALRVLKRAAHLDPTDPSVFNNEGLAFHALGESARAISSFEKALKIRPGYAEAYSNRGVVLGSIGRSDEAERDFRQALSINPRFADALANLGKVLTRRGEFDEALGVLNSAIATDSRHGDARNNLAALLARMGRFDEALVEVEIALSGRPNFVDAIINLGCIYKGLGRHADSLERFDEVLRLNPSHPAANWNKALTLLLLGDFELGWELYEWGFRCGQRGGDRGFRQPRWNGEPLEGKTILLHHEQGHGDTIQFCRYAKLVAERGGRVILEAPQALLPILQGLEGVAELVALGDPLPPFDCYSPLLSLPRVFGTRLDTIPAPTKYLSADPARVERWRERLGPSSQPRLGIAWSGSRLNPGDRLRNIPLATLLTQLPPGYEYISLQTEVRDGDREALASSTVRHFGDELKDFGDTAALCELCERVISVDTSVVHLNAALGRPTQVLLPAVPEWRWLLNRQDSPWYHAISLIQRFQFFQRVCDFGVEASRETVEFPAFRGHIVKDISHEFRTLQD